MNPFDEASADEPAPSPSPVSAPSPAGEPETFMAPWNGVTYYPISAKSHAILQQKLANALANPSPAGGVREAVSFMAVIDDAWQELSERDDRTSPEEYPDMCLITPSELAEFMHRAALSSPATPEPVAFDPLNGGCPHCKWLDTNLGRVLDQKCDLHQKIEDMQSDSALDRGIIKEQAGLIRRICEVIGADDDDDPVERAKERMDEIAELEAATPEPVSAPANGEVVRRVAEAILAEDWKGRGTPKVQPVVEQMHLDFARAAIAALSNPAPGHGEGGL